MIGIETSGEYLDLKPHGHMIVTDGLYTPGGTFYHMPRCDIRALRSVKHIFLERHFLLHYACSCREY
ncbi:MAG: hypothetical protein HZC28_10755 [Spirochaetes bacterium]|nr:hypothetical protein [Spirochaetota bacterium]